MTSPKKQGRPPKSEPPRIDHDKLDKLLVLGEVVPSEDGSSRVDYPGYRELAARFGVSNSLIARYAKAHNCLRRRADAEQRTRAMAESKIMERRAEQLAVTNEDAIQLLDKILLQVIATVEEGRFRADNAADLNTLLRLKQLLVGGADSRQEMTGGITLEMMQARHREMMCILAESTPAERGEVERTERSLSESPPEASDLAAAAVAPAATDDAHVRAVGADAEPEPSIPADAPIARPGVSLALPQGDHPLRGLFPDLEEPPARPSPNAAGEVPGHLPGRATRAEPGGGQREGAATLRFGSDSWDLGP